MPDLCLTYHITQDDFVAAQRAHQRRNLSGRIQFGLGLFLFGLFILMAVFSVIFTPRVWMNYTLPLMLAAAYLYIYYFAHRLAYRRNSGLFSDIAVSVSPDGIHIITPHSESTVPWSRYQRWIESDNVFLLYVGQRTFNIIPKRVLTADQQDSLRTMLKTKVVGDASQEKA
jgi:uncharacterized membrane protein